MRVAYATFSEQVTWAGEDIFIVFPTASYATFSEQVGLAGASSCKACRNRIFNRVNRSDTCVSKISWICMFGGCNKQYFFYIFNK